MIIVTLGCRPQHICLVDLFAERVVGNLIRA